MPMLHNATTTSPTTPDVSPLETMDNGQRECAAQLFSALSHPARLAIVEHLYAGPATVGEIAAALHLAQPATSQHLSLLTRAGLLVAEPRSRTQTYRLRGPRIPQILRLIREFCTVHRLAPPSPDDQP